MDSSVSTLSLISPIAKLQLVHSKPRIRPVSWQWSTESRLAKFDWCRLQILQRLSWLIAIRSYSGRVIQYRRSRWPGSLLAFAGPLGAVLTQWRTYAFIQALHCHCIPSFDFAFLPKSDNGFVLLHFVHFLILSPVIISQRIGLTPEKRFPDRLPLVL